MCEFIAISVLSAIGIVLCIYILHFGLTEGKHKESEPCVACRNVGFPGYNFCPNCGRKLSEKGDGE